MAKKGSQIDEWIQRYLKDEEPRSKSLMISVFGDSISPYAEGIWLGDFIELLAPLGLNERLVRTSAFRLIDEGWLCARREGRRSYYTLTTTGMRRFESAYSHIYTAPLDSWDGTWTVVLLPRSGEVSADRAELKRELEWSGFASPTPGLLLHPTVPATDVRVMLDRYGLQEQVVVMSARTVEESGHELGNSLLSRCWDLGEVEARYERFLSAFAPLEARVEAVTLTPLQAFQVQTLLIHSFRRVNLHDPRLPLPMLPTEWPGLRAYQLCRKLYARTHALTLRHLRSLPGLDVTDIRGGRLKMPVGQRFGGLPT